MGCRRTKIKNIIGYIILGVGILIGVCARFVSHNTAFHVEYLYGISCGLMISSIAMIIIGFIRSRNPKYRQKDLINEQDERNQLIETRSVEIAYKYLFYSTIICFMVDLFIPLSFHYTSFILFVSTCVVQLLASVYYRKKY